MLVIMIRDLARYEVKLNFEINFDIYEIINFLIIDEQIVENMLLKRGYHVRLFFIELFSAFEN